jgi:hypothetical protein
MKGITNYKDQTGMNSTQKRFIISLNKFTGALMDYHNRSRLNNDRVSDLLERMTLGKKCSDGFVLVHMGFRQTANAI